VNTKSSGVYLRQPTRERREKERKKERKREREKETANLMKGVELQRAPEMIPSSGAVCGCGFYRKPMSPSSAEYWLAFA
jgi:hypothetical protein